MEKRIDKALLQREKVAFERVKQLDESWNNRWNTQPDSKEKQKAKLELDAAVSLHTALLEQIRQKYHAATTHNEISRRAKIFENRVADEAAKEAAEKAAENDRTGREKNAENEHKRTNPLSRLYSRLKTRYNKYTKNAKNKKNAHNKLVAARRELYNQLNKVQSKGIKRERGNNNNNNEGNNQGGGTRRRRRA